MGSSDSRSISGTSWSDASSDAEPLVYALDRRGPNDRRVNSAHLLVLVLVAVLGGALILVM